MAELKKKEEEEKGKKVYELKNTEEGFGFVIHDLVRITRTLF